MSRLGRVEGRAHTRRAALALVCLLAATVACGRYGPPTRRPLAVETAARAASPAVPEAGPSVEDEEDEAR